MGIRRKKSFLDTAADTVTDTVLPAIGSAVDSARDKAAPFLEEGKAIAAEKATEAREAAAAKVAEVRETAGPKIAEARESGAAAASHGKERAAVKLAAFKDADNGARLQAAADAEPGKGGGRLKKLALLAVVAGIGAVVFKKLRGGSEWQASYQPTPPPAGPVPPAPTGTDSSATDHLDDPLTDPIDEGGPVNVDAAGAAPGEALSDQAAQTGGPHADTNPDAPAETVDLANSEHADNPEGDTPRP